MQLNFLIITKNGLYNICHDHQTQLAFLPQSVRYQEIIDRESFEKLLSEYFSKFSRYKTLILLANDIVSQKTISATPETNIEKEIQEFIDIIPFASAKIEKKVIHTGNNINIYATNSDIYKTIIKTALQFDWQIEHVVPLMPFSNILQNQITSYSALKRIAKEKQLLKSLDFLKQDEIKVKKKLINQTIHFTYHADYSGSSHIYSYNAI